MYEKSFKQSNDVNVHAMILTSQKPYIMYVINAGSRRRLNDQVMKDRSNVSRLCFNVLFPVNACRRLQEQIHSGVE